MDFMIAAEYTQIVWGSTMNVGIAMKREEGYYRIVVIYTPKGNVYGQYAKNVKMPKSIEQGGPSGSS